MSLIKKYFAPIFLTISAWTGLGAQELTLPPYTQYLADNPFLISPTFAGIGDHLRIRLSGVTQWVGVKNAPDTQALVADMRIGQRSGIGVLLYNDSNGFTEQKGAKFSFAHHLTFDAFENHFFSFGLSYNYNQIGFDTSSFDPNDPNVNIGNTNNHNFDVGFLYRKEAFYFAFNASNLLNKDLDLFAISEPNALRNYYMYSGYRWKKNKNSDFEIEPSAFFQLFESDGRSNTDLNIRFRKYDLENNYWAGISYRFLNDQLLKPLNITPMIGLTYNKIFFAYGYQLTLNELIGYNSGTHMVTVGIDIFQGVSDCPCVQRPGSGSKAF